MIYGILLSQKELKGANEYLIALMKTVSYRMNEKAKSEEKDVDEVVLEPTIVPTLVTDPNVATANAPSPDLAHLSHDVK